MKKLLFLLLAAILPMMVSAYDAKIDGIYYNFNKTAKTATVTYEYHDYSHSVNAYSGTVNIPASVTYNEVKYSVKSIGEYAFYECRGLTSVMIPNSVTSIGYSAFYGCSGLTSVTIPNSVTIIGSSAFAHCSGLTSPLYTTTLFAYLPTSYSGSYNIPNGIKEICGSAFSGCSGLTSITIPNSVTSIGYDVFNSCSSLTSITIPNSVTSIGYDVFNSCSSLTSIKVENGNTVYDSRNDCNAIIKAETNELIYGCKNTIIPNSVTSIGGYAFYGCSGLTSVTIPNSVTSIGNYAFYRCSGLTSVTIPNSVTSIGYNAFNSCIGLTSVTIGNGVTRLEGGTFYDCRSLTSISIPNSVTSIEKGYTFMTDAYYYETYGVFENCSGLTSIIIPNSVTSIGNEAFSGCSGLTSVTIPNSVTSIGDNAFSYCSGVLTINCNIPSSSYPTGSPFYNSKFHEVLIGDSVTSIVNYAFYNSNRLTSVTIPNSVTSIGTNAFSGCTALMTVKSYIKEPFNISRFSEDTYRNGTLYVPNGTKDLYIRFDGWREFLNIVEMEEESAPNGQCAKPSIIIAGKEMRYECETPGAEFESILTTEEQRFGGNKLVMENKDLMYILTVYATAPGYDRSEPTQVKFIVSRNDVNQDGTIDVADIATIIDAMAGKSREEKAE